MDDNTLENLDSETQDVQPDDNGAPEGDYTAVAQVEQKFRDQQKRAEKAEAELKALREKLPEKEGEKSQGQAQKDILSRAEFEEAMQLRDQGFSTSEIDFMRVQAQAKGRTVSEIAEDPFVKHAIEGVRKEKAVDSQTPSPSSSSPQNIVQAYKDTKPEERSAKFSFEAWKANKAGNQSE